MAGVMTGTATIPAAVQSYFDRSLLVRSTPYLCYMKVAQERSLKARSGNTIVFRRYPSLPLATTPLTEGHPPAGRQMSKTDITATIQSYGDYITLTDLAQATVDSPLLNEANKLLSEQAAQTMDALLRDVAAAGTDVFYGGGSVSARTDLTTTTEAVDTSILDRALRSLEVNLAKKFTTMIQGSGKVGTTPIRPAFWAITHPDVVFTLEHLTGWKSVETYASQNAVMPMEVGSYKNLRVLSTTNAKVWLGGGGTASGDVKYTVVSGANKADIYSILIFGQDAIATVPLEGLSLQNVIKPLGAGGTADPLNQISTSGWKHTGARVRLNEANMTRIEVTARELAAV